VNARRLTAYLEESAARWPDRVAVVAASGTTVTYATLDRQGDALAAWLRARGVRRGDRVGVVLPKTPEAVASLFGVMKAGAAYVPVDCMAPVDRCREILTDCAVRAIVVDARYAGCVPDTVDPTRVIVVGAAANVVDLRAATPFKRAIETPSDPIGDSGSSNDLAYILYTSGSTGRPKGVMLSHENAVSFVEWCSSVFGPTPDDRFSSHAPFHFDLSIFDIYVAIKHGASVHLISEDVARSPKELARFVAAHHLTIWYSTPSILTLMLQFGNLQQHDASSLRLVLFAGEVFPVKHLRAVQRHWPAPAYYNLYGPTETNVCTFAQIPACVPDDRETPYPIGFPCAHCRSLVLGVDGREVAAGEEGLLHISGPSVFAGYWNRPAENAAAFVHPEGERWYNTGDVVRWSRNDGFVYVGRKDRMVKRRGYRIELGEIERALYAHPQLREVAVIAVTDADAVVSIVAYVSSQNGRPPSIVELKTFCAGKLPAYMSPDRFVVQERLPKTSTDKVDYQALKGQYSGAGVG